MTPLFHPHLVNGSAGDPVVYIDFLFEHRALLFDLGEVALLPPRKILRLTDLFVSHAHMDHFVGFDHLLRVALGRGHDWRLFGPPGFIDQIGHRLAAYTWNLVDNYDSDFVIAASEWDAGAQELRHAAFCLKQRFRREVLPPTSCVDGVLLDEELFRIRSSSLDHGIPSLAFCLEEKLHLNVWKNRLEKLGLPTGPWLKELKAAVRRHEPEETPFSVRWHDRHGPHERVFPLGQLQGEVLRAVPGQKITFVVDCAFTEDNARRIIDLAQGADVFFCESAFLDRDRDHALKKHHLTARQAGTLAQAAGVRRLVPMHFSARYLEEGSLLEHEAQAAFAGQSRD